MTERVAHKEYGKHGTLSFSSYIISAVFFTVLSQFLILRAENITPLFRPLMIVCALLLFTKRGYLPSSISTIALLAAVYELLVLLFEMSSGLASSELPRSGSAVFLYLWMCSFYLRNSMERMRPSAYSPVCSIWVFCLCSCLFCQ